MKITIEALFTLKLEMIESLRITFNRFT